MDLDYTDYDTRLAAYGVIVDDGRVLLALYNGSVPGTWTLPGGGVEFDEPVEDGVVREVLEETGLHATVGPVLGVRSHIIPPEHRTHDSDRPLKAVQVLFRVSVADGELRDEIGGSTDTAAWVPLAELPTLRRSTLVDTALELAGVTIPRAS